MEPIKSFLLTMKLSIYILNVLNLDTQMQHMIAYHSALCPLHTIPQPILVLQQKLIAEMDTALFQIINVLIVQHLSRACHMHQ